MSNSIKEQVFLTCSQAVEFSEESVPKAGIILLRRPFGKWFAALYVIYVFKWCSYLASFSRNFRNVKKFGVWMILDGCH